MAIRSTMTTLVARVRDLCGLTESAYAGLVSDDRIQEALDRTRMEVNLLHLNVLERIEPVTGKVIWKIFTAPFEDFEPPVILQSGNQWALLTPEEEDLTIGRWAFAEHQASGVFLSARTYDRYAAAADILETVAAPQILRFSFTAPNGSFNRQEIRAGFLQQAQLYYTKARPVLAEWRRGDVNDG